MVWNTQCVFKLQVDDNRLEVEGIAGMAIDTKISSPDVTEWIGDVIVLERHIDSILDRYANFAEVPPIVHNLHQTIHESRFRAESLRPTCEEESAPSVVKEGLALLDQSPLLIERIGDGKMSHMFRNCFVACNLAAITYSMLHTSAIALENEELAAFAAIGLRTYAGVISEISTVMPEVVVQDLVDLRMDSRIDANAAAIASSQQQEMWESMAKNVVRR